MAEPILATRRLTRHFGGLAAVNEVSIECHMSEVHAVIGPNGAGKTTLVNLLSGDLPPSSGNVLLQGRDIAGLAPHLVCRRGVGRSFQKTNVFLPFSVFENCRLAAQAKLAASMRFLKPASANRAVNDAAGRALEEAGLGARADVPVAHLSHGEQRQVEIAMTLATGPAVLLLDEPLAGMGPEESLRIIDLLKRLSPRHAILLVEHDMDAVFALADVLTVMVNGSVLETGSPESIRNSPAVLEAYLGTSEVLHE